jgi:hypothetical protein
VAKVNHTYVIELRPDKADQPMSGFDHPEDEAHSAAVEIYDGFLAYINSFINHKVDNHIALKCKSMLNEMLESLDAQDYQIDANQDFNGDDEDYASKN